ncbi:pimeloyl-ACP methyl ester carboxylesterase [Desulfobotulus alkaliphilus]|uniref:Pimeloyl-ACP methyl ester carboxylesterase n=1 Tax=Desulfobotulus alkaliphilus TaxID=622671 RepID=A0A562RMN2_9BACT|nr:alpha/beta hydrolase [Desulfobotulus alkaliphilus]TWI70307.1 pimeloyl-ACP methyl ester carboxylesterase [Desulfobotulus alkaliphilus]
MQTTEKTPFVFFQGKTPFNPEKPSLLFIHGAGLDGRFWKLQMEGLYPAANCFAITLPGRGASPLPACSSVADQASHIAAFLDHMKIEKPFICGISMGGAIVLNLLAENSACFSGGIIINSGARLRVNPGIFEMVEKDFKNFKDLQIQLSISPSTPADTIKPLLDAASIDNPDTITKDFRACDGFDIMDRLHRITAPVLILTASDDQLSPVKYGHYLKEHISGSLMECIEGAGHLSPLETPEAVNQAILHFISSPE